MSEYKIIEEKEKWGLFKKRKTIWELWYNGWYIYKSYDKEKVENMKEKYKIFIKASYYRVFELESGEYSPMYKSFRGTTLNYKHLNPPEYYEKMKDACDKIFELEKLRLRRFVKKAMECV